MFKKALIACARRLALSLALIVSTMGASTVYAQTAGQAISGFLLAQGSTYGSFTCPSSFTSPCFVQYGAAIPVTGTFSATLSGFTPTAGATATLSATGTSADTALPAGTDIVVSSPSTNTVPVFIRLQAGAGTALISDLPVNPGAAVGFHITTQTHISGITGGTAASLQIQGGSGLATGYGGGGNSGGATNATIVGPLGTQTLGNSVAVTTGNGNDVAEGSTTDNPSTGCPNSTSAGTIVACQKAILAAVQGAVPAGTNLIGKVGIDQTTPGTSNGVQVNAALPAGTNSIGKAQIDQGTPGTSNAVQAISGTTGGVTAFTLTATASTNATNVKASAGTLYHIAVYNNSATLAWVSFYNTSGTPTCGTSIVYQTMIPANSTSGAGAVEDFATGMNFSTGIGICVTTGIAGTGSVAATSYVVGLGYK